MGFHGPQHGFLKLCDYERTLSTPVALGQRVNEFVQDVDQCGQIVGDVSDLNGLVVGHGRSLARELTKWLIYR